MPEEQTHQPLLNLDIASPSFFRTLGIEIVSGRAFTDEDNAEDVRSLSRASRRKTRIARQGRIRPAVYRRRAQFEVAPPFLAVRTAGDPIGLAPARLFARGDELLSDG